MLVLSECPVGSRGFYASRPLEFPFPVFFCVNFFRSVGDVDVDTSDTVTEKRETHGPAHGETRFQLSHFL